MDYLSKNKIEILRRMKYRKSNVSDFLPVLDCDLTDPCSKMLSLYDPIKQIPKYDLSLCAIADAASLVFSEDVFEVGISFYGPISASIHINHSMIHMYYDDELSTFDFSYRKFNISRSLSLKQISLVFGGGYELNYYKTQIDMNDPRRGKEVSG